MRYLLLLMLGIAGALALAWYFELGTAATAATGLPSLAPAYLAWKAFQHDQAEATAVDLETVADQLAQAVQKQWDDEAAIRRVNDPYPLPVAWRAAEPDLVEPWHLLTDVALAWPGGPPGDPARWPADAAGLAGADAQIGEVFAQQVPTRRLVVLGEPGTGKTMLLIRLLQDLIERRQDGGPVPVLFSLASWDPAHQPLEGWLAGQLRRSHPGLRAPAPVAAPGADQVDLAQALLDARRVLPLLDGFDELPPALHALALDALNRGMPAKAPLVVASRAAAYRAALTRPDTMVRLNGAAGIHLLPLTAGQAADYLRRDAGGPHTPAADRWNTVIAHLGTAAPAGQALSTPLGLFLARTIYNPRPHARPSSGLLPAPDELVDIAAFPTRAALDTHLFNAFTPAAYAVGSLNPPRWSAPQANRTLVFLARHLEVHRGGSPDLAWWELRHAIPAHTHSIVVGLISGLSLGLGLALRFGLALGLAAGILGGTAVGIAGRNMHPSTPSARLRWSSGSLTRGLALGLAVGLTLGAGAGLASGPAAGLTVGLTVGLAVWLTGGLTAEIPDLTTAVGPVTLLTQDRRTFLAVGLSLGLALGLAAGLTVVLPGGELAAGLAVGLTVGPTAGLAVGLERTAWGVHVVARAYLALRRRVPWDLMAFLQDAHEHRGVLRQVGAVYQFRHLDLQRHLAHQPGPP